MADRGPWELSPQQAMTLQLELREQVQHEDALGDVHYVAGVDVGFEQENAVARAAVAVLRLADLTLYTSALARRPVTFPYIPGLLSFRETPVVLDALAGLPTLPDLLLYDGHGLAHPRRFGIACHVGLLSGIPTIGVAKSVLIGTHRPVPDERGAWQPLKVGDEVVGAALRTRAGTKPIYVSIGHRVSLETAIRYVLRCTARYRLPETTRWAHRLASGRASDT